MKPGAALPMALFALCLVGALTVGGAWVARRAADDARLERDLDLGPVTEQALAEVVGGWGVAGPGDPPIGAPVSVAVTHASETQVTVWVTRIANHLFWLVADAARTRKPLLHKRIAILIRVDSLEVRPIPQAAWFDLP